MHNYNDNIIKYNAALSLIYKGCGILLSLITVPLLLRCLGNNDYGIWVTTLSFVSWIYFFDFGIGNGLRNKLAEKIAINDSRAAKQYLGTAYKVLIKISLGIFIVVFIGIQLIDINWFFKGGGEYYGLKGCLIIAFFLACVNFVLSLSNNVVYAVQKASLVNGFNALSQLLFVIAIGGYILFDISGLLYVALAEGVCHMAKNLAEMHWVYSRYPDLKFSLEDYNSDYKEEILTFGLKMFVVQITALILTSTDNILIAKMFGAENVTQYSLCFKYFSIIETAYVAVIAPFLSAYTSAKVNGDYMWIRKSIRKNIIIYIVFALGMIVALFLFNYFIQIWLHTNINFDKNLIVFICVYNLMLMFIHIFTTFLTGIGMVNETTVASVVGTIINIPLSICFAKKMELGISGIALGSIACLTIQVIIAPIVALKRLKELKQNN